MKNVLVQKVSKNVSPSTERLPGSREGLEGSTGWGEEVCQPGGWTRVGKGHPRHVGWGGVYVLRPPSRVGLGSRLALVSVFVSSETRSCPSPPALPAGHSAGGFLALCGGPVCPDRSLHAWLPCSCPRVSDSRAKAVWRLTTPFKKGDLGAPGWLWGLSLCLRLRS